MKRIKEKVDHLFDDVLEEHLFRHCAMELSSASDSVLESRGYVDNVADLIQALYKRINPDVGFMKINTKQTFVYDDMDIFKGVDTFFDRFRITIVVNYNENYQETTSSGEYNDQSFIEYDGDSVCFWPEIFISVRGSDNLAIRRFIGKTLGHELTHAYNDYELFVNSKGKKRLGDSFLKGYSDIARGTSNTIEKNVDNIIYFTDRSERNAHIAQIRQELDSRKNYKQFFDALTFTEVIKSTETYKKFVEVIDMLNELQNLALSDTTGRNSEDIVKVVNALTGNKFKRFRQAFNFLKDRVAKTKMKIEDQSPKIAHDVYLKNKFKF